MPFETSTPAIVRILRQVINNSLPDIRRAVARDAVNIYVYYSMYYVPSNTIIRTNTVIFHILFLSDRTQSHNVPYIPM